jgi:hypothetical protein
MSGSRLPGDEEGNDRHRSDVRAEARLDDEDGRNLATRFERAMEGDEHRSKARLIRKALDEYLPDEDDDGPRIKSLGDEELETAFRTLQRLARPRGGTVLEEQAASVVAQELGVTATTVKSAHLESLAEKGVVIRHDGFRQRSTIRVMLPEDADRLLEEQRSSGRAGAD